MSHQEEETKGLGDKMTELAANISAKTADAIAKPLLNLIVSSDNADHQNEPLSALLNENENFFSTIEETTQDREPLRSKTLAHDTNYSKSFQPFTKDSPLAGLKYKEQQVKKETPKSKAKEEDDDELDEDEEARLLRMIEQESDSDDEDGESDEEASEESQEVKETNEKAAAKEEGKQGSDNSIISEEDILNRSLQSDCDEAIDSANYLKYVNDKYAQKQDLLEIVDKNERSFKQVAEKMITQSSQLIS